ncbi:HAMP domain-containing histidine kinase [Alkalicella caledoniensis]|uniref:histidine kinase n=1 Tax=Alkalicella caledoniensis TaxID=2731377 RepID=A0A7G9W5W2_ALKCA|nr:HAMP domain-containing sensor histidine kinase [Alkalicella caledoniensis]QNO14074.1 HAMP domain-containing histidine kinase [Alkalicella caledoniensis]
MDTSSNNKHIKHASVFTILVLILFTLIAVGSYGPIKEKSYTGDDYKSYMRTNAFANYLAQYTRYLMDEETRFADFNNVKSIKYHILDMENGTFTSNIPDVTQQSLQGEKGKSVQHIVVTFDEVGNPNVQGSTEINTSTFYFNLERSSDESDLSHHKITYLIYPGFEDFNDVFTTEMKLHNIFTYHWKILLGITLVSISLLIIAAIAVPYSYQRKVSLHRIYNSIFIEFKLLFFLFFAGVLFFLAVIYGDGFLFGYSNHQDVLDALYKPNYTFYLIGIPVTFIIVLQTYLGIVYLKYVSQLGIYKGFILNSLFLKVMVKAYNKLRGFVNNIFALDITNDYHKTLLRALIINVVILWVISFSGFIGYILAIVYTVYLFNYLTKFFDNLKEIHLASEEIARGNFEITLNEKEAGLFEPISKNLNNIKEGFQVAVNEELKSEKMKTDLITNVSHDLKTPLTSIITYVDLLKKETSEELRLEYIDVIDKKSNRLKTLIEDLFEASRASSGNIELNFEQIDAVALLRQTMGEFEDKINESNLQFKISLPEDKVHCNLDGKKTYRVFENILSNILKYSLDNSRVYVDVEDSNGMVSFTFKNISSYEMNFDPGEMTERFNRGDKSRNTEGSGLGLAIAKDLVELQKGSLSISIDGDLFKLIISFPK